MKGILSPGVLVPLLHHALTFVSFEEHPRIYIEVNSWGIIATKILLFINEYNYFIFYSPIGCKILLFSVRSPRKSWHFFSAFSWVFFEIENPFSLDNHLLHLLIKCYHHYLGVNNSFFKPCLFAFAMYAAPSGYLRRYLHHFSITEAWLQTSILEITEVSVLFLRSDLFRISRSTRDFLKTKYLEYSRFLELIISDEFFITGFRIKNYQL